jgi:Protein of unknown function, DUF481
LKRSWLVIGIVLFTHGALADQITMKDGDRITGDIVKKDGDTLTVKSKNFGTVTLKWDDVATVRSDQPLNVVLQGGQTVEATIETQGDQIQVAAPDQPRTVPPGDIVALRDADEQRTYERLQHPGLLDLWTINGSFGIAGTKGNAETSTFTTPFNFARTTRTSQTTAYFNSIRSTATVNGTSAQTAQAVRGGWAYSHQIFEKIFGRAFNDYEYDKFQALDLRVVAGGGIGYQFWDRETSRLTVEAGGSWNRESFGATDSTLAFIRNSGEAYWGDNYNLKLNTRTNLTQSFRMFNNLSDLGQRRVNFDVGASTQLTTWLTWSISLSDRYLSNPVPGRKNNDFLYSTSFGFQWAR